MVEGVLCEGLSWLAPCSWVISAMYNIHSDGYPCCRPLRPLVPGTEYQVGGAISTDFNNKPSFPRQEIPWKTWTEQDNEQGGVRDLSSPQWEAQQLWVATNNASSGGRRGLSWQKESLCSQVRFDTTSGQRASLWGFFAWFCSVFICKSLTEVLKQNPNHHIFVGSLHWKIIVWLVCLFYRLGLTYTESLTLNKAIVQMKSLTGRELKNCDSRTWCLWTTLSATE